MCVDKNCDLHPEEVGNYNGKLYMKHFSTRIVSLALLFYFIDQY